MILLDPQVNACQSGSTGMTSRIQRDSKEILCSPADEWRHLGKTSSGTWIVADNFFADFAIILYLKIVVDIKIYVYLPSWFNFVKFFNPKDVKK